MTTAKSMRLEKLSPRSPHLSYEIDALRSSNLYGPNGNVTLTARLRSFGNAESGRRKNNTMSAFVKIADELIGAVEMSRSDGRDVAVYVLGIVRDGVITGEGPTTRGRIHF